ncbi:MAG TPA: hypothetical protein VKH44_01835 [Pirellulaceae bacterium]|nr:hypothetical protein [Pirellulaceae bacterium]
MNPGGARPIYCPCGAENPSDAKSCWLCLRELPGETTPMPEVPGGGVWETDDAQPSAAAPARVAPLHVPVSGVGGELPTLSLWLVLALMGFGIFFVAPGLAILFAIAIAPALVRTTLVVSRRSSQGKQVPGHRKVLLFIGSLGTSVIVLTVVLVAAVGSFCAVCLSAGNNSAIPVAALFSVVVTGGVLFLVWKWIRRRWQRDVEKG